MDLQDLYNKGSSLIHQGWLIYGVIILIIALIATLVTKFIYRKIHHKLAQKEHYLISALIDAIYIPFIAYIWIQSIILISKSLEEKIHSPVEDAIKKIGEVAIALLFIWLFIRFIRLFEQQLLMGRFTKNKPDKTTVHATGRLLRIIALVVGLLIILPVLGIPISGIVAFGGGSAIAVGIAAQQILANYFGGVIIYSDRHFKVGDWISSPDRNIEGNVEYIGWRSTRIRTFDKRPLYVPNAVFSSIIVINDQRMQNRRIIQTIGLRYEDAPMLEKIIGEIRKMLKNHPEIEHNQRCMVHLLEFGESSLNIQIYCFTKTTDFEGSRNVQQDIFFKILKIIEDHKAGLAYPTTTIYFANPPEIKKLHLDNR